MTCKTCLLFFFNRNYITSKDINIKGSLQWDATLQTHLASNRSVKYITAWIMNCTQTCVSCTPEKRSSAGSSHTSPDTVTRPREEQTNTSHGTRPPEPKAVYLFFYVTFTLLFQVCLGELLLATRFRYLKPWTDTTKLNYRFVTKNFQNTNYTITTTLLFWIK